MLSMYNSIGLYLGRYLGTRYLGTKEYVCPFCHSGVSLEGTGLSGPREGSGVPKKGEIPLKRKAPKFLFFPTKQVPSGSFDSVLILVLKMNVGNSSILLSICLDPRTTVYSKLPGNST